MTQSFPACSNCGVIVSPARRSRNALPITFPTALIRNQPPDSPLNKKSPLFNKNGAANREPYCANVDPLIVINGVGRLK